ncbi:MAG: hypothetical protein AB1736_09870 [Chloroflexota bacterium]
MEITCLDRGQQMVSHYLGHFVSRLVARRSLLFRELREGRWAVAAARRHRRVAAPTSASSVRAHGRRM